MKRNRSKVLSIILLCSFVFSSFAQVYAGEGNCGVANRVYTDLNNAYNIVNSGQFYTDIQNARPFISHAQRLLKRQACSGYNVRKIDRILDKAKTEILWNNRHEAMSHISCAMRMVEGVSYGNSGSQGSQSYNNGYRAGSTAAGAIIAAPVAIGLGALFAGLFSGNWGYIRTRVSPPRLPTSVVPVR